MEKAVTDPLARMSDMLSSEILTLLGLPSSGGIKRTANRLFRKTTEKLAQIGLTFDQLVMESGFPEAAAWALAKWCRSTSVRGVENIPREGPVLIVSNHPGTYDGLVLIAQLPRPDVHLIASALPFFKALPNGEQYLVFVNRSDPHQRMSGAREALRRLKSGKLVLLYGSGTIDPDPAVYPDAEKNIESWYSSIELFPRLVPEARVLIALVSHVVSPKWANHIITRLRKEVVDKRRLAEFGQILQQLLFPNSLYLTPCISFSQPVTYDELKEECMHENPMSALTGRAKQLLTEHCLFFGSHSWYKE